MKINIIKTSYILFISIFLFSCSNKNEDVTIDPLNGYTKLVDGYAKGASAKVEIWGQKNFFMGYNKLMVVLYDSLNLKDKLTDAHIQFSPLMTMTMNGMVTKHAAPVENPEDVAVNEVFPGAVAFVMPTAMDGSWQLGVYVHNHKIDRAGEVIFDVTVDNPAASVMKVFSTITADNSKLVLSLLEPSAPKVGMNDIEFTIHRKASMMDWPADDSYSIEITPEMPSMGHGSPGNINPVSSGNGHYKGKVNFTMTGEWKVSVLLKKDGVPVSQDLYFMITF
ncbi:MAG: FixH family protein [Prolixibacteraceae bacterium]